jgi:hypothetical protein
LLLTTTVVAAEYRCGFLSSGFLMADSETKTAPWVAIVIATIGVIGSVGTAYFTAASKATNTAQQAAKSQVVTETRLPLGTIIQSLLNYEQMKSISGDAWVPADGRFVPGTSEYAKLTGRTQVPDLRGRFVRGLNTFDPATGEVPNGDPDKRDLGSLQDDSLKGHDHAIGKASTDVTNSQMTSGSHRFPSYYTDGFAAAPALRTDPSANATETRPKNVALFFYVKIN